MEQGEKLENAVLQTPCEIVKCKKDGRSAGCVFRQCLTSFELCVVSRDLVTLCSMGLP